MGAAVTRKLIQKEMREVLRDLRTLEPTIVPVRVRRLKLDDCWGYCTLYRDSETGKPLYFLIAIDNRIPAPLVAETLVHEWAHAVAWQEGKAVDDHGPEWGVTYARIYSQVIDS